MKFCFTYEYSTCNSVSKNVEMNEKTATSPEGGFSGTSGRQKPTQLCISASENWPFSLSTFEGLKTKKSKHQFRRLSSSVFLSSGNPVVGYVQFCYLTPIIAQKNYNKSFSFG